MYVCVCVMSACDRWIRKQFVHNAWKVSVYVSCVSEYTIDLLKVHNIIASCQMNPAQVRVIL